MQKKKINSLLPIGRQTSSHFRESWASGDKTATWEDKFHDHQYLFFTFPVLLFFQHDAILYGRYLWSSYVSCPDCVPSQPLAHTQSISIWTGQWREKALTLSTVQL